MPDDDSNLIRQLAMTDETWPALLEVGLVEGARMSLDFSYDAADETAASALVDALTVDAVTASVSSGKTGPPWRRRITWGVGGFDEIEASLPALSAWVTAMVERGEMHGCTFDGWVAGV